MSYLCLQELRKNYGRQVVLNQVDLEVEKGALVSILGPSGCGKTTLLRAIAGLVPIDGGSISIAGKEISQLPPRRRELGMLFQSYALFPNLNVRENIAFGLRVKRVAPEEREKRLQEIIDLVGLGGREKQLPHQLSGGQQQRTALARSLVVEPKLLLLDEPLSALDASLRRNLQAEIRRIQQSTGITMLLVTHDQQEALGISDRMVVMQEGQVVRTGTPEEVYYNPGSIFVAGFIGGYNILSAAQAQAILGIRAEEASYYAVRPEAIRMHPVSPMVYSTEECFCLNGIIMSISVQGNYLSYEVHARDIKLRVDCLNVREQQWAKVLMEVRLLLPRSDCLPLKTPSVTPLPPTINAADEWKEHDLKGA